MAIGYSGGVDSAYLVVVARCTRGAKEVLAIIGRSASYPAEQWTTARRVTERFDLPVFELETDEMSDLRYAVDPSSLLLLQDGVVEPAGARGSRARPRHAPRRERRVSAA